MKKLALIITLAITLVTVNAFAEEVIKIEQLGKIVYQNPTIFSVESMNDVQKKMLTIEFKKYKLSFEDASDEYQKIEMYLSTAEVGNDVRVEAIILTKDEYFTGTAVANKKDFSGNYFNLVKSATIAAIKKTGAAPRCCPCDD